MAPPCLSLHSWHQSARALPAFHPWSAPAMEASLKLEKSMWYHYCVFFWNKRLQKSRICHLHDLYDVVKILIQMFHDLQWVFPKCSMQFGVVFVAGVKLDHVFQHLKPWHNWHHVSSLASSGQKFRDAKAAWILDYISLHISVASCIQLTGIV